MIDFSLLESVISMGMSIYEYLMSIYGDKLLYLWRFPQNRFLDVKLESEKAKNILKTQYRCQISFLSFIHTSKYVMSIFNNRHSDGSSGKEFACQGRRLRFYPWIRKKSLEEETATHSSILARGNLTEIGAWGASVCGGHKRVRSNQCKTMKTQCSQKIK